MAERDETQDVWVFEDGGDCLGVTEHSHYLEQSALDEGWCSEGDRYVSHSDLLAAEQRAEAAEARVKELEHLAAAYREIGEAWLARAEAAAKRNPPSGVDSDGPHDGSWAAYSEACKRVTGLVIRAAEHARGVK